MYGLIVLFIFAGLAALFPALCMFTLFYLPAHGVLGIVASVFVLTWFSSLF